MAPPERQNLSAPIRKYGSCFLHGIWLFPVFCTAVLLLLTAFKVSGSSIGVYNDYFYGRGHNDSSLLFNEPRPIRSDEWLVNTQMTIAQKNNGYDRLNINIGRGEDTSLLIDVPYKDWSVLFKPHNLAFFVLPFDNAFAFRWWLMAYLLMLSCYFFVLALLPTKRLLASLIAIGIFFSPFIQWWYLYGTLGVLYYSLFGGVVLIKLLDQRRLASGLLWGSLLAYLITCFMLVLYPPFQIPAALTMLVFTVGYLIEKLRGIPRNVAWQKLSIIIGSIVLAGAFTLAFLATRQGAVQAITNTAYPGQRVQLSGGYDLAHLFSGHLAVQHQYTARAAQYNIVDKGIQNQSETSNFILIMPFLILPGLGLLAWGYKKNRKVDWPLLVTSTLFVLLLIRLYVPHFNWLFKVFFLDKVPHNRLIIGIGLLSLVYTVLFIRHLSRLRKLPVHKYSVYIYVLLVFIIEVSLGLYAKHRFPEFIGNYKIWLLAIPIPIIVYLLLTQRFRLAALAFLLFSVYSSAGVNPLYRGTSIITETPLSQEIRKLSKNDTGKWANESIYVENFATLNGAPSLSGVYTYPQLQLWKSIDQQGRQESDYNRYAHINFEFDRSPITTVPTALNLVGGDNLHIRTEPCSDFLKENNVRYLLTSDKLDRQDPCVRLISTVKYPVYSFFIYHLDY